MSLHGTPLSFVHQGGMSLAVGPVSLIETDFTDSKSVGADWLEEMLIDGWHQDG